jgi:hypothetical protein
MKASKLPRPETLPGPEEMHAFSQVKVTEDDENMNLDERADMEEMESIGGSNSPEGLPQYTADGHPRLRRAPGPASIRGWWRWFWTTMRIPDSTIFRIYGIDTWSYLQFLKFCIVVFFILTIIGLAVYLPTNLTGANHMKGFNGTGMGNLPPGDDRAYIHLAGVYVITFIITILSFRYFKQFTRYRQRYKKLALLNNFSCMVTNVPLSKGVTTSAKLQAFFEKLYPNQVASATLLFNLKPLEKKIKERQAFIRALERCIASYQATGIRPTHSLASVASKLSARDKKLLGIPDDNSSESSTRTSAETQDTHNITSETPSTMEDASDHSPSRPSRRRFVVTTGNGDSDRIQHTVAYESGDESDTIDPDEAVVSLDSMELGYAGGKSIKTKTKVSFHHSDGGYEVDSMTWYQQQIDDLDEEIELERQRVEESEDLQEAVPLVISQTVETVSHPMSKSSSHSTIPASTSLTGSEGVGNAENSSLPLHHHGDSVVTTSTPSQAQLNPSTLMEVPGALVAKGESMLWRLSKKLQPDREEDEAILNEPFEVSDIPAEADPALAAISDQQRKLLATTTALLDPRHDPSHTYERQLMNQLHNAQPLHPHQLQQEQGEADFNIRDIDAAPSSSNDSDGIVGVLGTPLGSSTPTIEAAKARRLTRSISRSFAKGSFASPHQGLQRPSIIPGHDGNVVFMDPATAASQPAATVVPTMLPASSGPSTAPHTLAPRPLLGHTSNGSSGSLSHLPIAKLKTHTKVSSSTSPQGKMSSSTQQGTSMVDYDVDADEEEEERRDAQESIWDRLMIRVPGWESLKKIWRNWVVGAPTVIVAPDGTVRESVYRPTTVGFVTFKTLTAANHCANSGYLSKSFFKWRVEFAPAESDIQWRNIRLGWWQQWIRYLLMVAITCVLIIFWGVPVGFMAQWANIDHLETLAALHDSIVWLKGFGPTAVSILTRLSPTLTLLIFMNLLVPVIRVLFDYVERPATRSGQELKVFRTYYAFLLFNVLFLSTLTSQISNIVTELIRNPSNTVTDVAKHLGETLPVYGAFFINYILNAAFISGAMGLPRVMFFLLHFVYLKMAKSPAEVERAKKESVGGFEYDYQYAAHLNIFTIALCYSSMVPLILPTALLYFMLWFAIDKYNLVFAYGDQFDRSGAWTPLVFRRVFAGIAIYHFAMFGTFLVKQNYICSGLLLPMFIFDLIIHWYAINTFAHRSQYVPLDEATRYPHTAYQLGLEDGYVHPAMHDVPDPLTNSYTRYDTRNVIGSRDLSNGSGGGFGMQHAHLKYVPETLTDSIQSRPHPSLVSLQSSSSASSISRKRVARSLGDELGLAEQ